MLDNIRRLSMRASAAVVVAVAAGVLSIWILGGAGNARPEARASVRVSVSVLNLSRLGPQQFGDWEPESPPEK